MGTIYLNHAGTSWPKPPPVRAAVAEALQADPAAWTESLEAAHRIVADFFHIDDPARLLLTPGCTSALAVAVADHPWAPGDRVLTSGLEHHALHRPLTKLTEQGVELEILPRAQNEPFALDALERSLRRGGVRMVALSAASNVTGELLPTREAITLAHEFGALALVDGAQVAGWWDLDVPATGADLFAFAGHKGPLGPWGIGGLYIAPHVAMRSPAATCDISPGENVSSCATMPGNCDVGSVDRAALAGLAAAVRWLHEPPRTERLARARALAGQLQRGLEAIPGIVLHGPADITVRMPTVAFTMRDRSPAEVAHALTARGIVVSAGLQCAPLAHETLGTAPDGVIRLSVGVSNDGADISAAVEAVKEYVSLSG